jgi:hypothetical protein
MTKRVRNYKEEYRKRIERAFDLGYSRTIARGHPKKHELSITEERKIAYRNIKEYKENTSRVAHERLKDTVYAMAERGKTQQAVFIRLALEAGFTERQAYSLWFSP